MTSRRLNDAGLLANLTQHSFRVAISTGLLKDQGIPLGEDHYLLCHSDPRTTKICLRDEKRITRNLVERINL